MIPSSLHKPLLFIESNTTPTKHMPTPSSPAPNLNAMPLPNIFLFLLLIVTPSLATAPWSTLESSLMQQACHNTDDLHSCLARLRAECNPEAASRSTGGPYSVLHAAIKVTINEAISAVELITKFTTMTASFREQAAIQDCMELLDYSVDELGWSLAEMRRVQQGHRDVHHEGNLGAWLSAALSNQDTCLEGFEGTDGRLKHYIKGSLSQVSQLVNNVMAMYKRMSTIVPLKPHQNVSFASGDSGSTAAPRWIGDDERSLVHMSPRFMQVDATVAPDGSGTHRSIMEAVNAVPDHGGRRYVIYVKKGLYRENVEIKKKKTNVMLVGDGIGATVITSDRSFARGWTTFRSATVAVSGQGFIARDMTFRNTAGPENHQAVALRSSADHSAFFRCSMEGYQDTLYVHSLRQFYRDCAIHGTVDFIFGNANAVIQHSRIFPRKPLPFQKVTVTAQGRKDPAQSTGLSIHQSFIYATAAAEPVYLGRPWMLYSRTVFMQCYMGPGVHPRGWLEWAGDFALSTLYYGEYMNYGPGASTAGRVKWPGYHLIRDTATAGFFTVRRFINGDSWLPSTGVTFTSGLTK